MVVQTKYWSSQKYIGWILQWGVWNKNLIQYNKITSLVDQRKHIELFDLPTEPIDVARELYELILIYNGAVDKYARLKSRLYSIKNGSFDEKIGGGTYCDVVKIIDQKDRAEEKIESIKKSIQEKINVGKSYLQSHFLSKEYPNWSNISVEEQILFVQKYLIHEKLTVLAFLYGYSEGSIRKKINRTLSKLSN